MFCRPPIANRYSDLLASSLTTVRKRVHWIVIASENHALPFLDWAGKSHARIPIPEMCALVGARLIRRNEIGNSKAQAVVTGLRVKRYDSASRVGILRAETAGLNRNPDVPRRH